jgi:hypothetical protein
MIKTKYFWADMRRQCWEIADANVSKQKESSRFKLPSFLSPAYKGDMPFLGWCLDCIGPMQPSRVDGA